MEQEIRQALQTTKTLTPEWIHVDEIQQEIKKGTKALFSLFKDTTVHRRGVGSMIPNFLNEDFARSVAVPLLNPSVLDVSREGHSAEEGAYN